MTKSIKNGSLHNVIKTNYSSINTFEYKLLSTSSASQQNKISNKNNNDSNGESINNEPINFFGSKAASWKAQESRSGGSDESLWYQPYVISGSLAIFLIYFCILREENDIDKKLEGKLYDHVDGLEEIQLSLNYKYNKEHGLDVTEIEKRLKELGIDVNTIT